jgi:hypothetical protein
LTRPSPPDSPDPSNDATEPHDFGERVWARIVALEREFFRTPKHERPFTYRIESEHLLPSHTDLRIPRADFDRVLPMLPISTPAKIAKYVTGFEYVFAVLHDPRVTRGEW